MTSVCPARVGADPLLSPRYINHSCAPNCVAEVVTFDKEDKIIIISSRRIPKGEEVSEGFRGCWGGSWGTQEKGGAGGDRAELCALGDSPLPPSSPTTTSSTSRTISTRSPATVELGIAGSG